jgi:hypothetical protein
MSCQLAVMPLAIHYVSAAEKLPLISRPGDHVLHHGEAAAFPSVKDLDRRTLTQFANGLSD